jgi:hypothetical protein
VYFQITLTANVIHFMLCYPKEIGAVFLEIEYIMQLISSEYNTISLLEKQFMLQ